ncbi:unnamed protein product, partial [marine sediment metagenome]
EMVIDTIKLGFNIPIMPNTGEQGAKMINIE